MTVTPHTSYRLSAEAREMLDKLAEHYGLNRTSILEWLIREKARTLPRPRKPKTPKQ